jgi:hypothetical protein
MKKRKRARAEKNGKEEGPESEKKERKKGNEDRSTCQRKQGHFWKPEKVKVNLGY